MLARWSLALVLAVACQPKQPLQPSYFTKKKPANAPLDCKETLDCYAQCVPLVEECMLRCDERSSYYPVQRARTAANCIAQTGCAGDTKCEQEHCGDAIEACTDPVRVSPPPMPPPPPPSGEPQPPGGEPMPPQPPSGEPMPPQPVR
jgi:hypothetical protein